MQYLVLAMDDGGGGRRYILARDGAGAPSLVHMHTRKRCDAKANSAWHCRRGCGTSVEADNGDHGAEASRSTHLVSILLWWASVKAVTTVEYDNSDSHNAQASIWPTTCDAEVVHGTPRLMARSLPHGGSATASPIPVDGAARR